MQIVPAADTYQRAPHLADRLSRMAAMLTRPRAPRRDTALAKKLELPEEWVREFRTGAMDTRHRHEVDRLVGLAVSAATVDIRP